MISANTVRVLSVSPIAEDHDWLNAIFSRPEWHAYTDSKWLLQSTSTVAGALSALKENRIPLVLTERDLAPGSWRDMLAGLSDMPDAPLLIVASRFADERLWAEALNLGAYDVLAKPFDGEEVIRGLSLAWLHWNDDRQFRSSRSAMMVRAAAV